MFEVIDLNTVSLINPSSPTYTVLSHASPSASAGLPASEPVGG